MIRMTEFRTIIAVRMSNHQRLLGQSTGRLMTRSLSAIGDRIVRHGKSAR